MVADMRALADGLDLERFHALGSAAGSDVVLAFAARHGERLKSLILACSALNVADQATWQLARQLKPEPFSQLPAHIRELGPEYIAASPGGVAKWIEMEKRARPHPGTDRPPIPEVSLATLRTFSMPTMWIAGGADPNGPPSLLRPLATAIPRARFEVIANAGHSAYWEYPQAFSGLVIDFLEAQRARTAVAERQA
jgi:pimeloyl-ACP methyl ester carboxylesterase